MAPPEEVERKLVSGGFLTSTAASRYWNVLTVFDKKRRVAIPPLADANDAVSRRGHAIALCANVRETLSHLGIREEGDGVNG